LVIGVTGEVLLPTMVPLAVKTSLLLVKVELKNYAENKRNDKGSYQSINYNTC
jgi:hypothetical protein